MVDTATSDALVAAPQAGLVTRDAVTIFARDRSTGDTTTFAFWLGIDTVTTDVIDGDSGDTVSRTFVGQGGAVDGTPLISVSDVPSTNDLSIREVSVVLSQLHPTVLDMITSCDVRLAAAQVHRFLLDPATQNVVAPPICHFIGYVDAAPLATPVPGDEGNITLTINSDTQELTRVNPAKLADQTQQRRHAGDKALQYVAVLGAGIDLPWGEAKVSTTATK
jgi:hypothetical protein